MASYGVFLSICGFTSHCPKGELEFSPKLTPENFKAAFTAAAGWGSYSQRFEGGKGKSELEVKWGEVNLQQLAIGLPENVVPAQATVLFESRKLPASLRLQNRKAFIKLDEPIKIREGQKIEIIFP